MVCTECTCAFLFSFILFFPLLARHSGPNCHSWSTIFRQATVCTRASLGQQTVPPAILPWFAYKLRLVTIWFRERDNLSELCSCKSTCSLLLRADNYEIRLNETFAEIECYFVFRSYFAHYCYVTTCNFVFPNYEVKRLEALRTLSLTHALHILVDRYLVSRLRGNV